MHSLALRRLSPEQCEDESNMVAFLHVGPPNTKIENITTSPRGVSGQTERSVEMVNVQYVAPSFKKKQIPLRVCSRRISPTMNGNDVSEAEEKRAALLLHCGEVPYCIVW